MKINSLLAGVALMATSYTVCAQDNTVTVQTKKIGADIQPTMYGVFFEDIHFVDTLLTLSYRISRG